jgi:hypothetical protein
VKKINIRSLLVFNSRQLIPVLVLLFCWSCLNEELCEDISDVPIRVGFYKVEDNVIRAHSIDSITVYGLGRDSVIYNNNKSIQRVELPLDPGNDSCGFVFVFPEINDTVWFHYMRKPNLISLDCGFVTFYELEKIEHSGFLIQDTEITQTSITNTLDEHIRLFPLIFDFAK